MPRRRGLGEEDLMHKSFANIMKQYEAHKKLNCSWFSYDASGEKRTAQTGSLLKAKGLRPGKADFEIITIKNNTSHHHYLEFKTLKGKQSPNQKIFEESCVASNQHYSIVRSVAEAISLLEKEGIIKVNRRIDFFW